MLRIMDNCEVAIEQIKSLRMVHFYNIYRDDEKINALVVYYDRDKVINLCSLDRYYHRLLEKIWEVYKSEKNDKRIIADDYTRQILESATAVADDKFYEDIIKDYVQVDNPFCYHKGYMKVVTIPIIKYVLEQLYGMQEQHLLWNPIEKDWFGKGDLSAMLGEKKTLFPYNIVCIGEGRYSARLNNVLMPSNELTLDVLYKNTGIEIRISSTMYPINGEMVYHLEADEPSYIANISIDGKQVYVKNELLKRTDEKINCHDAVGTMLEGIAKEGNMFDLPWGQKVIVDSNKKCDGTLREAKVTITYLMTGEEDDYLYAIAYKNIAPENEVSFIVYDYALELYENKRNDGYIQMHFCDTGYGASGYYKTQILGNYYTRK